MRPFAFACCLAAACGAHAAPCADFELDGDRIDAPLNGLVGDPDRGARIAAPGGNGDCTLCHRLPLEDQRFHGDIGPDLRRIGAQRSAAQLRARIAAARRLAPASVMPSYCTSEGRYRVALGVIGEPVLNAQEIEDLVAWLATLGPETADDDTGAPGR